jgi:hypothetical protein
MEGSRNTGAGPRLSEKTRSARFLGQDCDPHRYGGKGFLSSKIPAQVDHLFRCKPTTRSDSSRPPVPEQADH